MKCYDRYVFFLWFSNVCHGVFWDVRKYSIYYRYTGIALERQVIQILPVHLS